jgi:NAD-dependent deacetylase
VHYWLSDKRLITQNIDGLDGKAGNQNYIPIHGRLDKVTLFRNQNQPMQLMDAPWDEVAQLQIESADTTRLKRALLETFKISQSTRQPELEVSLKPFILLFDEYYTDLFRMNEAERWMMEADKMVFIGTSFSVNITSIALRMGLQNGARIEIVDPEPVDLGVSSIRYHSLTAEEYIARLS